MLLVNGFFCTQKYSPAPWVLHQPTGASMFCGLWNQQLGPLYYTFFIQRIWASVDFGVHRSPGTNTLQIQKNDNQFSSIQPLSRVWLFATPWIAEHQTSLSITNSWSSLRLTSIESVMPSRHLILCCPLLLLPPIPPSIRDFSNESTLHMRWPKYWSLSFNISPSNEHPGLISFRMDWLDLLAAPLPHVKQKGKMEVVTGYPLLGLQNHCRR